ncbi:MAG: tripartite tricarboxylate transporter substrate binding protein BugE [Polaromonas sp.]|nr:tripartite tricarboxylate transporter substrate binding protein BugE [Polaromonas sp.]MDP3355856.1 tripartite tricarboxylate transporter substrate binding protein BugE [Polaromonas sp.]MDP3753253.1 tripartite tricarboxylate transporter substrate binding protein BugE [Polaromonas sp.]
MTHLRPYFIALGILATTLPGWSVAQTYPSRPVRLVVPFAPGGTTDLLARVISVKMGAALGQTVIVENKAGAGGAIGATEIAKAPPDGYSLLMSSVSTMATNPAINPKTPYNPNTDFVHIINVAATPNVIAVHPSFPAKDYKTFVELLRKEPGKYSYATAGNGSVGHLLAELYKSTAKVFVTHIPYRGSGPALNDTVAGQVGMVVDNLPTSLPFIQDKRLIPIVVAAPKRLASLPNVPTFAEVGLGPVNRMSFLGISAPKGTPRELVDKLNAAVKTALADPSVRERIEATGAIVVGNSAAEYQKQVKDEFETYQRAVREQSLKSD